MNEQKFKETLCTNLSELGFDVFLDKTNNPIFKKFRGRKNLKSLKKPDMIVFFSQTEQNKNAAASLFEQVSNPFGVETKTGESFGNHINKPIEQMREYKTNPLYIVEIDGKEREVALGSLFLCTIASIQNGMIYDGSDNFPRTKTPDAKYGIDWAITRQLFSLTGINGLRLSFGLLKKDDRSFYIQFPNSYVNLLAGGRLSRSASLRLACTGVQS